MNDKLIHRDPRNPHLPYLDRLEKRRDRAARKQMACAATAARITRRHGDNDGETEAARDAEAALTNPKNVWIVP